MYAQLICFVFCIFQVGEHFCKNNHLNFTVDTNDIVLYSEHNPYTRVSLAQLKPVYCRTLCKPQCNIQHSKTGYAYIKGEYILGAFLPIHHKCRNIFVCHPDVRPAQSVQLLEAMIHAVNTFNDKFGPYKGHALSGKLGLMVFDNCYNSVKISNILSQLH